MTPGMHNVVAALRGKRFPLENEKACQNAIWSALEASPATWKTSREHRLTGRDIIDFLVGGTTGVEVKLKGAGKDIARQLARYCASPAIDGLVLVTNKPVALPPTINGKPVVAFSLGSAWL
jgi:hypothetical protein